MNVKLLISILSFIALSQARSYDNYKVYSVVPSSESQVQILTDLRKDGYEFWNDFFTVGSDVRVMVAPDNNEEFVNYSKTVGLNPVLQISNVQELIEAQRRPAISKNVENESLGSFTWTQYHTLTEIHAWLDELQELYPDVVRTITIGTSLEGRDIKGVIIDFNSAERENNPLTGIIEGGMHSREWISPATVTWIIKEFLTSTDPDVRFLAETFVWHIFPVANPDGYAYTFSNDRMWRKNRNPANFVNCSSSNVDNDLSNGIDLNRNFNFLWMTTGASSNPCMQTYAGPSAGSERESQAVSNYVLQVSRESNLLYYFAFHSYSQMILVPYSHASGFDVLQADNYADMYEIGIRGAERLEELYGTRYAVGTSADILYEVSGSSFDWVKGVVNVPIVYLFELRDLGQFGFLLPAEQIIPNNEEIMACLLEMDRATRTLGYYSGATNIYVSVMSMVMSIVFLIYVQ